MASCEREVHLLTAVHADAQLGMLVLACLCARGSTCSSVVCNLAIVLPNTNGIVHSDVEVIALFNASVRT
jgi:hypothetical protein